jgi:hypothetical protein
VGPGKPQKVQLSEYVSTSFLEKFTQYLPALFAHDAMLDLSLMIDLL